jgi:phage regulator Rha-like protein
MAKKKPKQRKSSTSIAVVQTEQIEEVIHVLRGERVLLDTDLAELYGVETRRLNEQVRRNLERFPADFMFQLTEAEWASLRSQIVTLKPSRGRHRKYSPYAFTQNGVAMLSSVLRSPRAVQVNIEIMRAFVRMRRLMATPGELAQQIKRLAETVDLHDEQIKAIASVLQQMTASPEAQQMGFHTIQAPKKEAK